MRSTRATAARSSQSRVRVSFGRKLFCRDSTLAVQSAFFAFSLASAPEIESISDCACASETSGRSLPMTRIRCWSISSACCGGRASTVVSWDATRSGTPGWRTPTTVYSSPSRRIRSPMIFGSAPNRLRQRRLVMMATLSAPGDASLATKFRPSCGRSPSMSMKRGVIRSPGISSGSPPPTRR